MNPKLFLSAFFSFLMSCGGKTTTTTNITKTKDRPLEGMLNYYSELDKTSRFRVAKGNMIVAEVGIYYYSKPSGVHDGDGGTVLYLEINSEALLKKGAAYDLNNKTLPCTITEWGSPGYYAVLPQSFLKGKFTIVEYEPYQYLSVQFDIQIEKQNSKPQIYKDTIKFVLSNPWHRIPEGDINWEGLTKTSKQAITLDDLKGSWEAFNLINKNFQEKTNTMDTLLFTKYPYKLSIDTKKLENHLTGKAAIFTLSDNQLITKDDFETVGYINFIDERNLTITWKNKYYYQRLRYHKK